MIKILFRGINASGVKNSSKFYPCDLIDEEGREVIAKVKNLGKRQLLGL